MVKAVKSYGNRVASWKRKRLRKLLEERLVFGVSWKGDSERWIVGKVWVFMVLS